MRFITFLVPLLFLPFLINAQVETNHPAFKVEVVGEGAPLIMIPGLACSGEVWEATVEKFAQTYQCHVFTLAGFANQPAMIENKTPFLKRMRLEIIDYIVDNKLENPILMGHSLGGFLSLSIAIEAPQLPSKIIIVDSYPFYTAAMNPLATMDQAKLQANRLKEMLENQTDSIYRVQQQYMMSMMVTDPAQAASVVEWSVQSDRATIGEAMYGLMTTDLRKEVEQVACPILVLGAWYGGKDFGLTKALVKNNFAIQYKGVKNCTIKMAETAKHFIMFDEPEWFFTSVKQFLQ